MKTTSVRHILGGATAVGASMALLGSGLAGAAPSSTLSSGSGGSSDGSSSSASAASADSQSPYKFTGWQYCPLDDLVELDEDGKAKPSSGPACQTVIVDGGELTIGQLNVKLDPGSMMIAGGQDIFDMVDDPTTSWKPRQGSVHATPVTVPGGAIGTDSAETFGPTSITAHVVEAGTPVINTFNTDPETGYLAPEVKLPIRLKLSNPLLGDNCYIGTEDDPIVLDMIADAATMGNFEAPISENGEEYIGNVYRGVEAEGDTFTVPGATGCGPFGLGSMNWAVNLRAGLPSASGNNSIRVTSDIFAGNAADIYNANR